MDSRPIDRWFVALSALVPSLVAGCAERGIDESQFSENLCDNGLSILDAVEPADPVDYLELRDVQNFGGTDTPMWQPPSIADASGERCGGATDAQACSDALDALPPESEFIDHGSGWDIGSHRSLVFTAGDAVGAVQSLGALTSFLGDLDAPGDAALLAVLQGHTLVCGEGNDVGEHGGGGYVLHTHSGGGCGEGDDVEEHVVLVRPDGSIEVIQSALIEKTDPNCAVGRLPAGLCRPRRVASRNPVGRFLAEVAHLEAAAVPAFGQLARELVLHRAPRVLVRAALRSRRDEIRHARLTAGLARRFGARPIAPRVAPWTPRPFADLASDNAAEGCIRETYGALVAHAQARSARDPMVRRVLAGIAHDETRHAALSWALSQWARDRMSVVERRRVARHTRAALDRLEVELTAAWPEPVHVATGLPRPDDARALFGGLRDALFSGAMA